MWPNSRCHMISILLKVLRYISSLTFAFEYNITRCSFFKELHLPCWVFEPSGCVICLLTLLWGNPPSLIWTSFCSFHSAFWHPHYVYSTTWVLKFYSVLSAFVFFSFSFHFGSSYWHTPKSSEILQSCAVHQWAQESPLYWYYSVSDIYKNSVLKFPPPCLYYPPDFECCYFIY